MSPRRFRLVMGALLVLLTAAFFINVSYGAVRIPIVQTAAVLLDKLGLPVTATTAPLQANVVWSIRVPRALMALVVGAALAMGGTALQGVFRNPLAEPSLLGMTGGAVAFGMIATMVAAYWDGPGASWLVPLGGFVGALIVGLSLYNMFRRSRRQDGATFILTGVIVNVIFAAVITLLPHIFRGSGLGSDAAFWTMGGLGGILWPPFLLAGPLFLIAALWLLRLAPQFNLMALGDADAAYLGVDAHRLRLQSLFLISIMIGVAAAYTGIIAFVGLVVPHALRLLVGPDHRRLFPVVVAGGALMLTVADILARLIIAPSELPVGVLTTIVGGPIFLWLLSQARTNKWTKGGT